MQTRLRFQGLSTILILTSTLAAGGCAFVNRQVTLQYPGSTIGDSTKVVLTAGAADGTRPSQPTVSVALVDHRPDKSKVGSVRNGFYMHTADVVATNSVGEWITNALYTELEGAGYAIVRDPALPASYVVTGTIDNVHTDAYVVYSADIGLTLSVESEGAEVLADSYIGAGGAGLNVMMTASSYHDSLNEALASALASFIGDLRGVVK